MITDTSKKLKVALVYDRVNKWGGAERVIIALRKIFPDAPLYTSVYKQDKASWAKKIPVFNSFLQKIPFAAEHHEAFGFLMPLAFESFNFDKYDLVISVTSEAAKGIMTKPSTNHISIILTPTRYLWSGYDDYFKNGLFRFLTKPIVGYLRMWDKIAARRPDRLVSISETVRSRINRYYGLDSEIIYPPLMIKSSKNKVVSSRGKDKNGSTSDYQLPTSNYFLVVSRLVPYKRVDLAVKAATKLGISLKVIGTGNELAKLKKMAGPTVEFLGYISDVELKNYYLNSKALIFPGIEDFGLTMVEAQAFGKPIIAYRAGGAEEIVIEGGHRPTGIFFDKQSVSSLSEVLKSFKPSRYNSEDCIKNSKRFSFEQFKKKILFLVK